MAGLAVTNDFMLSTATVMLGPQADLRSLNPTEHGIGLVKNFTLTSEPAYTELTQGVKNSIVASVMTSNPVKATMETYEYTAKNLSYALGLEGADGVTEYAVSTAVAAPGITAGSPAETSLPVESTVGFTANDYILINIDNDHNFIIRKISSTAGSPAALTVTEGIEQNVPAGATVKKVHSISVGSKNDQPFYAAKIAGKLADGTAVVVEIPKVRITRGFSFAFTSDNFANMPMEFTVYDLVAADPHYSEFNGDQARLYRI